MAKFQEENFHSNLLHTDIPTGGQRAILEDGEVQSYEVVLQLAKAYFEQLRYKIEIENSEL